MIYAVHNISFFERLEGPVNHALVAAVEGASDDLSSQAAEPMLDSGEGVFDGVPLALVGHVEDATKA